VDDPATLAGTLGFLLAKGPGGRFTPIDVPRAPLSAALGINGRGQIAGNYLNRNATPSPQPPSPMMPSGIPAP
jgi:hypothetical protein